MSKNFLVTGKWVENYQVVIEADSEEEAHEKLSEAWHNGDLTTNHGEFLITSEEMN
jgi:peptidoglycan/xylan/chitin deacetylase (PgdA/CDA1 family)